MKYKLIVCMCNGDFAGDFFSHLYWELNIVGSKYKIYEAKCEERKLELPSRSNTSKTFISFNKNEFKSNNMFYRSKL